MRTRTCAGFALIWLAGGVAASAAERKTCGWTSQGRDCASCVAVATTRYGKAGHQADAHPSRARRPKHAVQHVKARLL